MATATVTSPSDPFTFHGPVAALAVPAQADVDEFEFHVVPAAAVALSAADELFSGGKLVPLRRPAPASAPCSPPPPRLEVEPASEPTSPRAPRCAGRRWRDLLLLLVSSYRRKPKAASGGDASRCAADRCLKARRRATHFRPLLSRDSSSSSSASSVDSGKSARRPPPSCSPLRTRSAPVANLLHLMSRTRSTGATRNPRAGAGAGPWPPQRGPSRPSRPAAAAESPRVSASGRVVFRGLERCASTPASAGVGPRRPRGMERSYSANVRVDPVISVFGFGHLFMPSSPAKERKADRERDVVGGRRNNRPEKLAMVLMRDPQD
ncbi:OSJNBa0058K23.8-like protein [Zea mays]|uniref:OSJNBa0058K23.8-like protein n=1 Tax=Zea mays TaxID=4577 RepID=A0A1D6JEK7_MAIZE|nr:OSJNBa0058K23.8-like protein [Zea mays]